MHHFFHALKYNIYMFLCLYAVVHITKNAQKRPAHAWYCTLTRGPHFSAGSTKKLTAPEALAGGLLLRFLQIIQFNAHEVSEFAVPAPRVLEGAKNTSLGAAIYPTLAYFNHSCHPGQVRYSHFGVCLATNILKFICNFNIFINFLVLW